MLAYDILQHSSLAKFIKKVYHGLRDDGSIHKVLNDWLSVSLSTRDISDHKSTDIRPYHSILVLDLDDCLKSLPRDASLNLIQVIKHSVQLKSMHDMEIELRIPKQQLYLIASHLEYWGKAKIIESLSQYNVYILNSKMKSGDTYLHAISPRFQELFQVSLVALLETFSFPKALHEHPYAQHDKFVEMVVWLLRHELIMQTFPHYYLVVPHDDIQKSKEEGKVKGHTFMSQRVIQEEYLKKIANASKAYEVLIKMVPYLNGKYRLSEISYKEMLKMKDIIETLNVYNDIIVTVHHE